MFDWLTEIEPAAQIIAMTLFPLALVGVAAVIGASWRRVAKIRQRTHLMEKMIERGMSPEEIGQVILTAQFAEAPEDDTALDPEVRLVKHLNKCWYSGSDVERILEAARGPEGSVDENGLRIAMSMASHWTNTDKIVSVLRARGAPATPVQPA